MAHHKSRMRFQQPAPSLSAMARLLARSGIDLDDHQLRQLWCYHQLLREHNPELNLTRIYNFDNMVLKLYVDSILPGKMLALPSPLLDLGTGPGMPGIPLKIAFPDIQIVLAESRRARVRFLRETCEKIGLRGIDIVGATITSYFEQDVAAVITRAVEPIARTLANIQGCLKQNGMAIFMKGPGCDPEIDDAERKWRQDYRLIRNEAYHIPYTSHARRLVVFKRLSESSGSRKRRALRIHQYVQIDSKQNARFKGLKKILTSRGVKKSGRTLLAGSRHVHEILSDFPELCDAWITRGTENPPPGSSPASMKWYRLSPELFDQLDVFGTRHPLLVVRIPETTKWSPQEGLPEGCTLFVPFQDPMNVGAVIRSAVAFGVRSVIFLRESAYPYHPKVLRSSGATVFRVKVLEGPRLSDLPESLPIIALSTKGQPIHEVEFPPTFGLLPGVEGPGLPEHWRKKAISIPMEGDVESLNAATATGIALYVWAGEKRRP